MPRRISQGRGLSSASPAAATTPNYSINHARSGSHSCSASMAPWLISISPLPARHSVQSQRFSFPFAGLQAQPHPVAEIVQCGEPNPLGPQSFTSCCQSRVAPRATGGTLQSVLVDFWPIFATFVSAPTIEVGGDCPFLAFGCTIGANCSPSAVGTRRRAG